VAQINTSRSVSFDGVDEGLFLAVLVNIYCVPLLNTSGWVQGWVKSQKSGRQMLFGCRSDDASVSSNAYISITAGGNFVFSVGSTSGLHTATSALVYANDNIWHHVLGVKENQNLFIFVDGLQVGNGNTGGTGGSCRGLSEGLNVGYHERGGGDEDFFGGRMTQCAFITGLGEARAALGLRLFNGGIPLDLTSESGIQSWLELPGVSPPTVIADAGVENAASGEDDSTPFNMNLAANILNDFPGALLSDVGKVYPSAYKRIFPVAYPKAN